MIVVWGSDVATDSRPHAAITRVRAMRYEDLRFLFIPSLSTKARHQLVTRCIYKQPLNDFLRSCLLIRGFQTPFSRLESGRDHGDGPLTPLLSIPMRLDASAVRMAVGGHDGVTSRVTKSQT